MYIARGRASADRPTRKRGKTFTGDVWGDPIMPQTSDGNTINSVTFAPRARTYWHTHTGGQVLVVTAGLGWVCVGADSPEDEEYSLLRAGDVVWTPPGELHWHGATDATILTHLGVSVGPTNWLHEVSDEEYDRITAHRLD